MDADQLARACADAMYANDRASSALGMEIVEVSVGRTVMAMTVRDDMVNGHDLCHGGLIFSLADSAFAFACNSHNLNAVPRVLDLASYVASILLKCQDVIQNARVVSFHLYPLVA